MTGEMTIREMLDLIGRQLDGAMAKDDKAEAIELLQLLQQVATEGIATLVD